VFSIPLLGGLFEGEEGFELSIPWPLVGELGCVGFSSLKSYLLLTGSLGVEGLEGFSFTPLPLVGLVVSEAGAVLFKPLLFPGVFTPLAVVLLSRPCLLTLPC
jgi:hypothetical protein